MIKSHCIEVIPVETGFNLPPAIILTPDGRWMHDCEDSDDTVRVHLTPKLYGAVPNIELADPEHIDPEDFFQDYFFEETTEETVYIALGLVSGLVKIGYSSNFPNRRSAYRTESAEPIEFYSMPAPRKIERALHDHFSPIRVERRREWFYPHPTLLTYMLSLG